MGRKVDGEWVERWVGRGREGGWVSWAWVLKG